MHVFVVVKKDGTCIAGCGVFDALGSLLDDWPSWLTSWTEGGSASAGSLDAFPFVLGIIREVDGSTQRFSGEEARERLNLLRFPKNVRQITPKKRNRHSLTWITTENKPHFPGRFTRVEKGAQLVLSFPDLSMALQCDAKSPRKGKTAARAKNVAPDT